MMEQDTKALARYTELLRAQTPAEKARTWVALCSGTRRMALAGLRARNPGLSEEELVDLLAEFLYGPKIAAARKAWREKKQAAGG
jgi:hypothetical protein